MKVKISYTIEDSEIPNELAKFVKKIGDKITKSLETSEELYKKLSTSFNTELINLYLSEIDDIRNNLTKTDVILSDCHEILDGLNNLLIQQHQQQLQQQQEQKQQRNEVVDTNINFEGTNE